MEVLQDEKKKDEYAGYTRVLLNEGQWDISNGEWEKMSEVMVERRKMFVVLEVSNPWLTGLEGHIRDIIIRLKYTVNE